MTQMVKETVVNDTDDINTPFSILRVTCLIHHHLGVTVRTVAQARAPRRFWSDGGRMTHDAFLDYLVCLYHEQPNF